VVSSSASTAEQEAFMRAFHRERAGVTAAAYGRGRSYAVIVDAVMKAPFDAPLRGSLGANGVLDLGCGDGFLLAELRRAGFVGDMVGIDLSREELAAARARVTGAALVQSRAQQLPFRDDAFAVVVSHLAFTLMADIDAVVGELARVIAPGGRFVTLVGGGPRGDDAFAGFLDLARPFVRGVPRLGDIRARSDCGLAELFAHGWRALTVEDVPIDLSGTPDEVWQTMAGAYELAGATPVERESLRSDFVTACAAWRRDDGAVACTMATRLVQVVRAGQSRSQGAGLYG
jgi:SAM-dependent methyltransferase